MKEHDTASEGFDRGLPIPPRTPSPSSRFALHIIITSNSELKTSCCIGSFVIVWINSTKKNKKESKIRNDSFGFTWHLRKSNPLEKSKSLTLYTDTVSLSLSRFTGNVKPRKRWWLRIHCKPDPEIMCRENGLKIWTTRLVWTWICLAHFNDF